MTTYQKLSITQKRALDLARVREASVPCPGECGMQLMPADLLSHLEQRCTGRAEPAPSSKWIPHREVMAMGVPRVTLSRWVERGFVRVTGERQDRKYLYRDLAVKVAQRRGFRRR